MSRHFWDFFVIVRVLWSSPKSVFWNFKVVVANANYCFKRRSGSWSVSLMRIHFKTFLLWVFRLRRTSGLDLSLIIRISVTFEYSFFVPSSQNMLLRNHFKHCKYLISCKNLWIQCSSYEVNANLSSTLCIDNSISLSRVSSCYERCLVMPTLHA